MRHGLARTRIVRALVPPNRAGKASTAHGTGKRVRGEPGRTAGVHTCQQALISRGASRTAVGEQVKKLAILAHAAFIHIISQGGRAVTLDRLGHGVTAVARVGSCFATFI